MTRNIVSHPRQISVAETLLSHPGTYFYFWFTFSGFPIWFRLKWGNFGPNGQKLHEYWKINILGAKIVKNMGRKANFLGSGGIPQSPNLVKNCFSKFWTGSFPPSTEGRDWYCAPAQFHFLTSLWQMGPGCSGDYLKMISPPPPCPHYFKYLKKKSYSLALIRHKRIYSFIKMKKIKLL